jgi:hypothetical protein
MTSKATLPARSGRADRESWLARPSRPVAEGRVATTNSGDAAAGHERQSTERLHTIDPQASLDITKVSGPT